eukprot:gene10088-biopygen21287
MSRGGAFKAPNSVNNGTMTPATIPSLQTTTVTCTATVNGIKTTARRFNGKNLVGENGRMHRGLAQHGWLQHSSCPASVSRWEIKYELGIEDEGKGALRSAGGVVNVPLPSSSIINSYFRAGAGCTLFRAGVPLFGAGCTLFRAGCTRFRAGCTLFRAWLVVLNTDDESQKAIQVSGKYGVYEVFALPPGGLGGRGMESHPPPFPRPSVPNGGGCGRVAAAGPPALWTHRNAAGSTAPQSMQPAGALCSRGCAMGLPRQLHGRELR